MQKKFENLAIYKTFFNNFKIMFDILNLLLYNYKKEWYLWNIDKNHFLLFYAKKRIFSKITFLTKYFEFFFNNFKIWILWNFFSNFKIIFNILKIKRKGDIFDTKTKIVFLLILWRKKNLSQYNFLEKNIFKFF